MDIDYKYFAVSFAREIQKLEHQNIDIDLNTIEMIRRFKTKLGINIPETLSEGTGNLIPESRKY